MDETIFHHTFNLRVRNYEIDWQGIVHNGNYLLYFETARVDYFKMVGMEIDERAITGQTKIVIVRNEIDYLTTATFDDPLTIRTRISAIKRSSIVCEAEMVHAERNHPVARNVSILVWLDPSTNKPIPVPMEFRKKVQVFEQGKAAIQWPPMTV